jgi:hypothetical protein
VRLQLCQIPKAYPTINDRRSDNHQMTETFQQVTDEKLATFSRSRWYRIRSITYWSFTVLLVFELAAGSLKRLVSAEGMEPSTY